MDIFPRSFLGNLRPAVESGLLRREDNLETVSDKLEDAFECDSLDLVEISMMIEEKAHRIPETVGDLIDLLEGHGPDNASSPIARK